MAALLAVAYYHGYLDGALEEARKSIRSLMDVVQSNAAKPEAAKKQTPTPPKATPSN